MAKDIEIKDSYTLAELEDIRTYDLKSIVTQQGLVQFREAFKMSREDLINMILSGGTGEADDKPKKQPSTKNVDAATQEDDDKPKKQPNKRGSRKAPAVTDAEPEQMDGGGTALGEVEKQLVALGEALDGLSRKIAQSTTMLNDRMDEMNRAQERVAYALVPVLSAAADRPFETLEDAVDFFTAGNE